MTVVQELETSCGKSVEHFRQELLKIRGGRASASLLENVQVDYYGTQTPLKQLGMISSPEPRQLTVQVYDANAVASVEKAIQQSDLGLNPMRDGNLVRVNVPALTEERRKDLIRSVRNMTEDARVSVRNHRRDAIDALKKAEKAKEISEDDLHRGQDEIQKITDKHIAVIDELLKDKEAEMMEV